MASSLEESLVEKAERLVRMADAIEESNHRKSDRSLKLEHDKNNAHHFCIDSDSSTDNKESSVREESVDLDELLRVEDDDDDDDEELEDEPVSDDDDEESAQGSSKENYCFAPVDLASQSDDTLTLQTNKTRESSVVVTPDEKQVNTADTAEVKTPQEPRGNELKTPQMRRGSSLNLIFSRVAANSFLDSEELDESKSFWTMQKSARNLSLESPEDRKQAPPLPPREELLEKNRGFQNALVSMRENARLRYQKLEMEHLRLQENYSTTKTKLESLKSQLTDVKKSKEILETQLDAVFGKDVASLLTHMNENQTRLERELHRITLERDQVVEEHEELLLKISNCPTCRELIKDADSKQDEEEASKDASMGKRSWWRDAVQATSQMLELDKEAEATTASQSVSNNNNTDVASLCPTHEEEPLQEKSPTSSSSASRPNPLDEDIESLKKRMDDELESMKDEWSTSVSSSRHHSSSRRHKSKKEKRSDSGSSSKKKKKKNKSGRRSSLEEFLSNAKGALNEEELDETQSFWSRSTRGVSCADGEGGGDGEKKLSESNNKTASKRGSLRKTKITTDDNWEHFSSNASRTKAAAAAASSSSSTTGRSRLRKMLALPSQAIFERARSMGDGLSAMSNQADEERNFLHRSARAFITTERDPAHRSAKMATPPEVEVAVELPPVELIGSRWTENDDDPLGFIGKEVTAWRGGATTAAVNS